jgi:phosphatidylinositol kinase/protein kinase (PI-3  family)
LSEWQLTLAHAEAMQLNFKNFQSAGEFQSHKNLENSLLLLSTSLKSIFSKLILTDIEALTELVREDEKKDSNNDDQVKIGGIFHLTQNNQTSYVTIEVFSHSNHSEQSKNKTAISVLLRVKQKLEGKDNPSRTRMSTQDHVKHLIYAATDPEALCRMYEGWMAWI